ncbi:hypothetical protein [Actinopolymorpha alba]|uniref:hypothetical protein n=1 Tax=Actinopolymorpha alba TaxID=533267 RepID=UPI0003AA5B44|nr:hypothetical protein [Actinopolymorpha alba]
MIIVGIILILLAIAVVAGFVVGGSQPTTVDIGSLRIESSTSTFFFFGVGVTLATVVGVWFVLLGVRRWRHRREVLHELRQRPQERSAPAFPEGDQRALPGSAAPQPGAVAEPYPSTAEPYPSIAEQRPEERDREASSADTWAGRPDTWAGRESVDLSGTWTSPRAAASSPDVPPSRHRGEATTDEHPWHTAPYPSERAQSQATQSQPTQSQPTQSQPTQSQRAQSWRAQSQWADGEERPDESGRAIPRRSRSDSEHDWHP